MNNNRADDRELSTTFSVQSVEILPVNQDVQFAK